MTPPALADAGTVGQRWLRSGARICWESRPGTPLVGVNFTYAVGSWHDPAERRGVAHLFEHLMFDRDSMRSGRDHVGLLHAAGATGVGGTVSWDQSRYYETLPHDRLPLALDLEIGRLRDFRGDTRALDRQRQVVLHELRMAQANAGNWFATIAALMFPEGHPYGIPALGRAAHVERVNVADIYEFHRRFYGTHNLVVALAGAVTEDVIDRTGDLLDAVATGAPGPAGSISRPCAPSLRTEQGAPVTEWVDSDAAQVYVAYRVPAFNDPAYQTGQLLRTVLGVGGSSLIRQRLTGHPAWVSPSAAYATLWEFARDCSVLTFELRTDAESPELVVDALQQLIDDIVAEGVSQHTLNRACGLLQGHYARQMEPVGRRADALAVYATLTGDVHNALSLTARWLAVGSTECQAFAAEFLRPEFRAVLIRRPRSWRPPA